MPDDETMTDEEYMVLQSQLFLLARLVRPMKVGAFLRRIARAETVGPIFDPTAYRAAEAKLEIIKELACGLAAFQRSLPSEEEAERADAQQKRMLGLSVLEPKVV